MTRHWRGNARRRNEPKGRTDDERSMRGHQVSGCDRVQTPRRAALLLRGLRELRRHVHLRAGGEAPTAAIPRVDRGLKLWTDTFAANNHPHRAMLTRWPSDIRTNSPYCVNGNFPPSTEQGT